MDETPEELARIREEAARIDPNRYRKRNRALAAVALGAAGAGLVALVLRMSDDARNPCERVRNHVCAQEPNGFQCQSYESLLKESVSEPSEEMRRNIRGQCDRKIQRLSEEGVKVP